MQTSRSALLSATFLIAVAVPALAAQQLTPEQAATKPQHEQLDTQTYLIRIAKAQLLFEVEREFDAAERELLKLRNGAMQQAETAPESFDGTAVLLELSLARVTLLLEQGLPEAALAGLEETVSLERAKQASNLNSRAWRTALAIAAREDLRITELMRKLENEDGTGIAQTVDELVNQFASADQMNEIYQLGTRAVPALKARILANLDRFSASPKSDELIVLIKIDEVAGGEFILAHLAEGGTLWRGRIVRAMKESHVLGARGAWEYSAGFPCNCRRAHWVELLEKLAAMPDVAADAIRMVKPLVLHGAITPRLEEVLIEALQTNKPKRVQAALYALDCPYWTPGIEHALNVAVAHESPHVRVFAANQLARYDSSAALRARATDPGVGVRRALARTLTVRQEHYPYVPEGHHSVQSTKRELFPTLGEEEQSILALFASDPDAQVRGFVIDALQLLDTPPEVEMIMQLVVDQDSEIRARMAIVARSLPPELRARVLLALAADENRGVLSEVDDALAADNWDRPELLLPVFRARQSHPGRPLATIVRGGLKPVLRKAMASDLGLNQLVDWAIDDRDAVLLEKILERSLLRVDVERMGRLLQFIAEVDSRVCVKFVEEIRGHAPDHDHFRPVLLDLARDEALSPGLRFLVASITASESGEILVDIMSDTLRHAGYWAAERKKGSNGFYPMVANRIEYIPAADRNRIILALVSDDAADSELAATVAAKAAWEGPLAEKVVKEIIDRWFVVSPPRAKYTVRAAILRMGSYPSSANLELLAEALNRSEYRRQALDVIGRVHAPSFLPALEQILANPGDRDWSAAVEAVTNYMSDDAAELLLNAATGAGSEKARNACLAGLQAIRDFQDARSHFATRRASRQTRDGAITDLVVMLDDENTEVRVQAIRALATFESVESIPRLIRMLAGADEATAKALRETLDRLNGIAEEEEQ